MSKSFRLSKLFTFFADQLLSGIVVDRHGNVSSTIVEKLAERWDSENAPRNLRGKRILKLDLGGILADAKNTQEVEAYLQSALKEVENAKENVILYLEDASVFSRYNPLFGAVVAKNLRSFLAEGKIRAISSATLEDYSEQIAADAELKNRFSKVQITGEEMDADDFVGDKLSPDLRALVANAEPNQKVRVILQSDDIKNPELLSVLERNNVNIETRAENLNMLVVELPVAAAEQIAATRGAKHLSLDKKTVSLGHIEMTTGLTAMRAINLWC